MLDPERTAVDPSCGPLLDQSLQFELKGDEIEPDGERPARPTANGVGNRVGGAADNKDGRTARLRSATARPGHCPTRRGHIATDRRLGQAPEPAAVP